MKFLRLRSRWTAAIVVVVACVGGLAAWTAAAASPTVHVVTVPQEDRFTPFALTAHVGDVVEWVNQDTDDHTVVSNNAFTTTGHQGTDHLLLGTDHNGGKPGRFALRFDRPGTFAFYCRFHAHLDSDNQPAAPGPRGGIQNPGGDFGTPMNGVVTVLA